MFSHTLYLRVKLGVPLEWVLHMTWRERSSRPRGRNVVRLLEQVLHEQLECPRDDDRNSGRNLSHVLVDLHDLLDPGLKTN